MIILSGFKIEPYYSFQSSASMNRKIENKRLLGNPYTKQTQNQLMTEHRARDYEASGKRKCTLLEERNTCYRSAPHASLPHTAPWLVLHVPFDKLRLRVVPLFLPSDRIRMQIETLAIT